MAIHKWLLKIWSTCMIWLIWAGYSTQITPFLDVSPYIYILPGFTGKTFFPTFYRFLSLVRYIYKILIPTLSNPSLSRINVAIYSSHRSLCPVVPVLSNLEPSPHLMIMYDLSPLLNSVGRRQLIRFGRR